LHAKNFQTTKKTKIFGGKNFDFFGFCNGHFFFQGGVPGKKIFVVAENDIDKKLLTQLLDRSGSCDKNLFFLFFVKKARFFFSENYGISL